MTDSPFFTTAEVAAYLGVHEKQVYRLLKRGGLPGTRVTGKWLFPKTLVDEFVARSAGKRDADASAVVVAGEDDALWESIAAGWTQSGGVPLARVPATFERALLLLERKSVDGVVVEHASDDCAVSVDVVVRRAVKDAALSRLWLARRSFALVSKKKIKLDDVVDRVVAVREPGSASRTLLEHRLLKNGQALSSTQPVVESHRAAIDAVLRDDVDAAFVPKEDAAAAGLKGVVVADLDVSLIVSSALLEGPLKQLPAFLTTPSWRARLVKGAGAIVAVAA